jgi:hypothetical protein
MHYGNKRCPTRFEPTHKVRDRSESREIHPKLRPKFASPDVKHTSNEYFRKTEHFKRVYAAAKGTGSFGRGISAGAFMACAGLPIMCQRSTVTSLSGGLSTWDGNGRQLAGTAQRIRYIPDPGKKQWQRVLLVEAGRRSWPMTVRAIGPRRSSRRRPWRIPAYC